MGIRLIVEVMDHWKDAGLTAGERDDLYVLAENANDSTRLTWGSVHAPYILARANKTAASWKNSIGKLTKKKVVTQHLAGHTGRVAVYHLTPLCPDPPHDGYQGRCSRIERVTSQVTLSDEEDPKEGHSTDDPGEVDEEPEGHLSDDPEGREGHLSGDERVTSEVTPSPLTPPTTPSTTASGEPDGAVADDAAEASPPPAAGARKKKPRKKADPKPNPHQVADDLTDAFWKLHGKGRAQPFVAVRGVVRTAIGNGVERNELAWALELVAREGRSISGATLDIALGKIRGRQRSGPYQDPEDQDDYDKEVA